MSSSDESHEDVSYHNESLFTSIPFQERIDNILYRIFAHKEIGPFRKKSMFKKLLLKLTKESVFSVNNSLTRHIDGCSVEGPMSVVFFRHFVCKMEEDILVPVKPHFCKTCANSLFEKLNFYHWNIN